MQVVETVNVKDLIKHVLVVPTDGTAGESC